MKTLLRSNRVLGGNAFDPPAPVLRGWRTSMMSIAAFSLMTFFVSDAGADVESVVVLADQKEAWFGERVSFFVELRSSGSFAGAASFDLPQLPGVMVMKIGNPVVGSQQLEGADWFIQTHEFALFSQRSGTLRVPTFPVRFAEREGFTGPAVDIQAKCPAFEIDNQRPPGSEQVSFLVTTESLNIAEVWEPTPAKSEVGAIYKRTITQRAEKLPGMALAAIPDSVPAGVRVYTGDVTTNDKLERGDFFCERKETVTYLLQKSDTVILPELKYVWRNPRTKTLESKTLPAVTFEVTAPPIDQTAVTENKVRGWLWPMVLFVIVGSAAATLITFQWQQIAGMLRQCLAKLNPPEQIAARKLLRACRTHNLAEASAAWLQWRSLQDTWFVPEARLNASVVAMQKLIFGPATTYTWNGDKLAEAFSSQQHAKKHDRQILHDAALPWLNPEK